MDNGLSSSEIDVNEIDLLVRFFSRLPGLGPRSSRRIVLRLMQDRDGLLVPLLGALDSVLQRVCCCGVCGNIDVSDPCSICRDVKRDVRLLCIVEDVSGVWALERTGMMRGYYHILGGVISALEGRGPEDLSIGSLCSRIEGGDFEEVILAIGTTVEGQTTAHYVAERLRGFSVRVSRLSHGVPLGGELDYMDDGTLALALRSRQAVEAKEF